MSLYLEAARTDATLAQAGAVAFLIKPSEMKHGAQASRRAGRSRPPVPVRVALTQLAKAPPPPGLMDEDHGGSGPPSEVRGTRGVGGADAPTGADARHAFPEKFSCKRLTTTHCKLGTAIHLRRE